VVFDLATINGRTECVGVSLRSYLGTKGGEAGRDLLWLPGPFTDDDLDEPLSEELGGYSTLRFALEQHEPAALNPNVAAYRALGAPEPLRAKMVRQLAFGDLLARAKRAMAWELDFAAKALRAATEHLPQYREDLLSEAEHVAADATELRVERHTAGRRRKYGPADLERVAELYRSALAAGSETPTKDVAEALDIPRSSAAKLIMRCRQPAVGLLGPTTKFKRGV